jgi:hypothetical protein
VYTVSNLIVVVELLRVEVGGRNRARWPQTTGGRKLGHPAYVHAGACDWIEILPRFQGALLD